MNDCIKGTVADIRFRNDENGYTIAVVETDNDVEVVVGVFPPVETGSYISAEGVYVNHSKYGRQLKAEVVKLDKPDTVYGIMRFLGSGLIKGIGEKRAAAIVEKFGKDTLKIIEETPGRLREVKNISARMAEVLRKSAPIARAF